MHTHIKIQALHIVYAYCIFYICYGLFCLRPELGGESYRRNMDEKDGRKVQYHKNLLTRRRTQRR